MRFRLNPTDKKILDLRKQLDNAYHIIRTLSDKKTGQLLGKIINYRNMNEHECMAVINDFYYTYVIVNSKDENLAEFKYFEIIGEKGNHITLQPISLSQIKINKRS